MTILDSPVANDIGLAGQLTRALFCGILDQDKRVAIFTSFSDESGTGDPNGVYLVGGYLATEEMWPRFAERWKAEVLDRAPKIPYLHMREIRREEFQKRHRISDAEAISKVSTATEFLEHIGLSSHPGSPLMYSVQSIIKRSDLHDMIDLIKNKGHKVQSGSIDQPDYLCFLAYAQVALARTLRMFPDLTKVDFVASANGKITTHFRTYLMGLKKRLDYSSIVGGLIPASPEDRNPLQMADVLCWHERKRYEFGVVDSDMERLAGVRRFTHEWTREKLEEFVLGLIARMDGADEDN